MQVQYKDEASPASQFVFRGILTTKHALQEGLAGRYLDLLCPFPCPSPTTLKSKQIQKPSPQCRLSVVYGRRFLSLLLLGAFRRGAAEIARPAPEPFSQNTRVHGLGHGLGLRVQGFRVRLRTS